MSLILDVLGYVSRLQRDPSNSHKESFVDNAALQGIKMQVQPASPEQTAMAEGIYGQTYLAFTTQSGILVGDRVTLSDTNQAYRVRGVEDWSLPDLSPHYEMTLVKMEEDEV